MKLRCKIKNRNLLMSQLSKFFRLPFADKILAAEAFLLLGWARFAVLVLPFRWVAKFIGEQKEFSEKEVEKASNDSGIYRIRWAVRRISRFTPWRSNCLAKAIAGHFMLRRRGISSTLYFGMTKGAKGKYAAHAWLKSNGVILTGGANLERYTIVATFSH
jgi:hypothetical protein